MIYVITHKNFVFTQLDNHYQVLHVGKSESDPSYLRDDSLTNISEKNPYYCELTGLYWIWKNITDNDITGLVHYRRYFTTIQGDLFYTYIGKKPKILNYKKIEQALKDNDIILPTPEHIHRTLREYYCDEHLEEDIDVTRDTIKQSCPEYIDDFDHVLNDHSFIFGNMMICRKSVLNAYCSWLFPILADVEKRIDINKYEDNYQKRVYGFLAERLLQVWVTHSKLKIKYYPVFNTEKRRLSIFQKNILRLKKVIRTNK